jgi:hypothetical protein
VSEGGGGPAERGPAEGGGPGEEHADFAAARVSAPLRRPPILLLAWLVVLGGVVALGLSGQSAGDTGAAPLGGAIATLSARITALPTVPVSPTVGTVPPSPLQLAPIESNGPGPIQLLARRHPETVFVHGDVYAENITWVFLSLRGADGRVAGWASVSVPGSASMVRGAGTPALRFDVELAVPSDFNGGPLVVEANAYDTHGKLVESTSVDLALDS